MAEAYKKINELTEMLAVDINESTKMVVSTGVGGVSKNLNVSDLVVNNLSSSSEHRALSAAMGKKLSEEKAPLSNPQFTGSVGGVTKGMVGLGNVDNTSDINKPVSQAVQSALDSKAPINSPTFTGTAYFDNNISVGGTAGFEDDVIVSENIIVDGYVRAYKSIVDNWLQFGADAKIKIQTGANGGTPVYREFPATELASSDLNGTQYVMVYGTGTPEENAAELQAAYDAAKNAAVRSYSYIAVSDATGLYVDFTMAGTFKLLEGERVEFGPAEATVFIIQDNIVTIEFDVIEDKNAVIASGSTGEIISNTINETTVIVAPGEYKFATSFDIDTNAINVISLTGQRDVIVNDIYVNASNCRIHGIESKNVFYVKPPYTDLIISLCKGLVEGSFGGSDTPSNTQTSATFIDCIGGNYAFGGNGKASGKFIRCIGGDYSFGGGNGTASGIFEYCKGGNYSFGKYVLPSGQFTDCTAGNNSFGCGTLGDGYFAGTARRCVGGTMCFKFGGPSSASAKLYYCEALSSQIGSMTNVYCIEGEIIP